MSDNTGQRKVYGVVFKAGSKRNPGRLQPPMSLIWTRHHCHVNLPRRDHQIAREGAPCSGAAVHTVPHVEVRELFVSCSMVCTWFLDDWSICLLARLSTSFIPCTSGQKYRFQLKPNDQSACWRACPRHSDPEYTGQKCNSASGRTCQGAHRHSEE